MSLMSILPYKIRLKCLQFARQSTFCNSLQFSIVLTSTYLSAFFFLKYVNILIIEAYNYS